MFQKTGANGETRVDYILMIIFWYFMMKNWWQILTSKLRLIKTCLVSIACYSDTRNSKKEAKDIERKQLRW